MVDDSAPSDGDVADGPSAQAVRVPPAEITKPSVVPADVKELLGPPPLAKFEDLKSYSALFEFMAASMQPTDAVEWIWTKDIIDLIWEARRLRRAKATLLAISERRALEAMVSAFLPFTQVEDGEDRDEYDLNAATQIADEIIRGDGTNPKWFEQQKRRAGSDIKAQDIAYQVRLDDLERIDNLIIRSDSRRDAVLRDMDRRRASFAKLARDAAEIIDAEFE